MGRKPLSQEYKDAIKEKLFEVSNRMILETGIENLNIRALCKEVGISYSSFYDYYNSKDELIAARIDAMDRYYISRESELRSANAKENIEKFIILYAEFVNMGNLEIIREVYRMQMYGGVKKVPKEERPLQTILKRIITEGVENKQFSEDLSIDDTSRMILSLCKGMVIDWCSCNGEYSIIDSAKSIISASTLLSNEEEL